MTSTNFRGAEASEKAKQPGTPVEYFYDFSSNNAYFGAHMVRALCRQHGVKLLWRPFNLGSVFKGTSAGPVNMGYTQDGGATNDAVRHRMRYLSKDHYRWAKFLGVEFNHPKAPLFPISSARALRTALAARELFGDEVEEAWIFKVYHSYWVENRDIAKADVLLEMAKEMKEIPPGGAERMIERHDQPEIRDLLLKTAQEGKDRGAFGAPTYFVGDDMFWGKDRLHFVENLITKQEILTKGLDIIR